MLKLRNLPLIKVNKSSSRDKQFDRPEKKLPNQPPFNITVLLLYSWYFLFTSEAITTSKRSTHLTSWTRFKIPSRLNIPKLDVKSLLT